MPKAPSRRHTQEVDRGLLDGSLDEERVGSVQELVALEEELRWESE
jgi:hypothetical protein